MTVRTFFAHHHRATNALSLFLALLLLMPSFAVFAQPFRQSARQVKPHTSPSPTAKPVDRLKVGDIIRARSNATGKVEWKQVIYASKRTVPALLSVQLADTRTGKPTETLSCPLDQIVNLSSGKAIPAGRLSIGNSIVTRAGPICKVKALFLLRKPGGFVLCDVRVGPLSAVKAKLLALSQSGQARSNLRFADYRVPAHKVSYVSPASMNSGTVNPFLFQGQQYDPASNTYYLRARCYAPTIGRFLSQDPYSGIDFNPVSLHRYLYANADPINYADPSGYDTIGEVGLATEEVSYLQSNNSATQIGTYSRVVGQITGQVPVSSSLGIGVPGIGTAASSFLGPVSGGAASSLFQQITAFGLVGAIAAPTIVGVVGAGLPNSSAVSIATGDDSPTIYLVHGTTLTIARMLEAGTPPSLTPPGYMDAAIAFHTARDDAVGREYATDYANAAASSPLRQGEGGPALLVIGVPIDVFLAAQPKGAATISRRPTTDYGFYTVPPKEYGFDALVQQWGQYPKYVIPLGP